AFLVAAVFSFFGSVFLGLVNVAVIDTAISKSEKSALWLAFGGVLPEIPYTLIAIFGTGYIDILESYKFQISIALGFLFILMGLTYIFKKNNEVIHVKLSKTGALSHFTKGFFLALANPQLIFFWSGYLILFQTGTFSAGKPLFVFSNGIWDPSKWSFAFGAAVGAFAILYVYTKLSTIYRHQLLKIIGDRLGNIIGLLFIVIGIFTIIKNAI
ncbi:LysE family transporter, partial [Bacteroidia bacterium]|nr:LysE family transporter [Bacteroidia bacterium]